ncbi:g2600 [Coccomyxa elongata]
MAELWWLLRGAVLHFIRAVHPMKGELLFNLTTRRAARDNSQKYANGLQRLELPLALRTFNLHMAICRLFQQEDARGPAAKDEKTWADLLSIGTINTVSYAPPRRRISYFVLCRRTTRWGKMFERRAAALPVGTLDAVLVSAEPVQPRQEDARKAQYYKNTVGSYILHAMRMCRD